METKQEIRLLSEVLKEWNRQESGDREIYNYTGALNKRNERLRVDLTKSPTEERFLFVSVYVTDQDGNERLDYNPTFIAGPTECRLEVSPGWRLRDTDESRSKILDEVKRLYSQAAGRPMRPISARVSEEAYEYLQRVRPKRGYVNRLIISDMRAQQARAPKGPQVQKTKKKK